MEGALQPIRLGASQLAVVLSGLTTVAVVMWMTAGYEWEDLYYRDVVIPRMQESHGFAWGALSVECPGMAPYTDHGVIDVVPGGRFSRLGLRAGDVPWERHGHAYTVLHFALASTEQGHFTDLDVVNAHDCRRGAERFRTISLHPTVREAPTALSAGSVLPSPQGTLAIGATRSDRPEDPYAVWVVRLKRRLGSAADPATTLRARHPR